MKKTALVTGSNGFVGQHMVRALRSRGYTVHQIDVVTQGTDWHMLCMDCRDYFREDDGHRKFDLVFHLAAVIGGRETIEGNPIAVAANLSIDAEMFGWAVRTHQPRVVYFSSSAAYPVAFQTRSSFLNPWLTENDINLNNVMSPDMSYGWAKLTGEQLARYAEAEGVRCHVFRPFSGYGPGQTEDYPFPAFAARAQRREDPFQVWGDGTQVRDFIHIDDVIVGTFAAIEQDYQGPVNLCTGIGTSFNQLAQAFMQATGYTAPIVHLDKPVGVHYRVGNPDNMSSFYRATITIEQGIDMSLALAKT